MQSVPGASRMVMGHTIQDAGVNAACGGKALRVDVGMSKGCGGNQPEALEVLGDGQRVSGGSMGLCTSGCACVCVPVCVHVCARARVCVCVRAHARARVGVGMRRRAAGEWALQE